MDVMHSTRTRRWHVAFAVLGLLLLAGCAGGPASEWAGKDAEPAGFFWGLWHGVLMIVTLVVSFFTSDVSIYEINNTGVGYNIGYVLGVLVMSGGGIRYTHKKSAPHHEDDIGKRVERKIRMKIESWVDEEEDWKDLGEKVEKKVKRRLRRWLDEEDKKDAPNE